MTGNADDAKDVAQETFLRAHRNLRSFLGDSSFYTWLYRIAVNVCLNAARQERRRPDTASLSGLLESGDIPRERLFAGAPSASQAERAELQESIQAVLNSLSPDHRAVVVLKDIEGLSQEEIAEILSCSVGTVKSRLSRARAQLRDLLRPIYEEWTGKKPP